MLTTDYYGEIAPGSREEPERKYTSVTETLPHFFVPVLHVSNFIQQARITLINFIQLAYNSQLNHETLEV